MISRIQNRLGTAGLIVAIVALVAALSGVAIAASGGLSKQQKKEVKKIAKTEAQKLVGTGPQGPIGPAGSIGKDGANGTNGTDGQDGAAGKSVVIGTATVGECPSGGTTVQKEGEAASKKAVCNGQTGFTKTLPKGQTLAGAFGAFGEFAAHVPISYSIPLKAPATVKVIKADNEDTTNCPGNVDEPKAKEGVLCLYMEEANFEEVNTPIASYVSGADLFLIGAGGVNVYGTWAVTSAE